MRLVSPFCSCLRVGADEGVVLGKLKTVISGHMGWVRSVAVEPGNQWFATGAGDRVIKVCSGVRRLGEMLIQIAGRSGTWHPES
jgi:WD40 repeat protein